MNTRLSTIEIYKEKMKFSAAHFTIFSATKRERLHGHNYNVYAAITTSVDINGLSFDYRDYKSKLYNLCKELNSYFLIPEHSNYLSINKRGNNYEITFDQDVFTIPQHDVLILPINNITVEELSRWFINRLVEDRNLLEQDQICEITVKVFSGPGQSGSTTWKK